VNRLLIPIFALALAAPAAWTAPPDTGSSGPEPRLERKDPAGDPSDYKDVVDSQGNRYKVDSLGNVFTNGTPDPNRQPASAENVIFYYNYAIDMMDRGYTAPALEVYREILALPTANEHVKEAQEKVREAYDEVYSFRDNAEKLKNLLFVVRHVEDGRVFYDNEKYRFRIRYPVNWKVENEVRHDPEQEFAGMNLYPLPLPAPNGETVTVAIGLRAERLQQETAPDQYRKHWVLQLEEVDRQSEQLTVLLREPMPVNPKYLRDHFKFKSEEQHFEGEDAFLVSGGHGYYVTFTATPETYEKAHDIFERFLSDFEILP
jgi:hypothetical protein